MGGVQTLFQRAEERKETEGEFGAKRVYAFKMGEIGRCLYSEESGSVGMDKLISREQKEVEAGEI